MAVNSCSGLLVLAIKSEQLKSEIKEELDIDENIETELTQLTPSSLKIEAGRTSEPQVDEVLQLMKEIVPDIGLNEEDLRMKLQYIGVKCKSDLEYVDFEKHLVPPLKLIEAVKLQRAMLGMQTRANDAHTSQSQEYLCSSPTSSSPHQQIVTPWTSQSLSNFKIPYEKFPPCLQKIMKEKKKTDSSSLINEAVRIVSNEVKVISTTPGVTFCRTIAQNMVRDYPETFGLYLQDGKLVDGGHHLLQRKLEDRFRNLNRGTKMRRSLSLEHYPTETKKMRASTKKDKYGCVRFLPSLPEDETEDSQERKMVWLIQEFQKPTDSRDNVTVECLMDETYASQRRTIVHDKELTTVQQQWPFLFENKYVVRHFEQLTDVNMDEAVQDAHNKVLPPLLEVLKSKVSLGRKLTPSLMELREQIKKLTDEMPADVKFLHIIVILMHMWKQDSANFIVQHEETTSLAEIKAKPDSPSHPHVAVLGDDILSAASRCVVVMENHTLSQITRGPDAVLQAFALFYVHSVAYPPKLAAIMEFIQRVIFKIDGEGSKVKRENSAPPNMNSRVAVLMEEISRYKKA